MLGGGKIANSANFQILHFELVPWKFKLEQIGYFWKVYKNKQIMISTPSVLEDQRFKVGITVKFKFSICELKPWKFELKLFD